MIKHCKIIRGRTGTHQVGNTRDATTVSGSCDRFSGGLWLCDNTIWSGQVATATKRERRQAGVTAFIREHNRLVADDTRYGGSIVPIRDGVMMALRIE